MTRLRDRLLRLKLRATGARLPVAWHPSYRMPLPSLASSLGLDPRRADRVMWALQALRLGDHVEVASPEPVAWREVCRVHREAHVERLTQPAALSGMYGLHEVDFPVDAVLDMVRRATGGTLLLARRALRGGGPTLNLLGGFHHASPDRAWGMCPINDIAVALAALRAEGFVGRALVLDLDAHPPDGTAACLVSDPEARVASISGSDWGAVGGAREVLLPAGAGDDAYLAALDTLLAECELPDLAFVVAGGDVRAGDPLGRLGLTEEGVAARDARVAAWLNRRPSVWLPGGGYRPDAWRTLTRTALTLLHPDLDPPPPALDPLPVHFAAVSASLDPAELGLGADLDDDDVAAMFGDRPRTIRLLGAYSRQGVELALERFGVLEALRRMGYGDLRVDLDVATQGDRLRLFGRAGGAEHLLVEAVLALEELDGRRWLFVHWLTLRHPRAPLAPGRHLLPGQDTTGLGLAAESVALLHRMSVRLGCAGLMFRPAWLHVAWQAREHFRFLDPAHQARFEALLRDLGHLGVVALSEAVHGGRVRLDGEPYAWPAEPMVDRDAAPPADADGRERCRFTVASDGSPP